MYWTVYDEFRRMLVCLWKSVCCAREGERERKWKKEGEREVVGRERKIKKERKKVRYNTEVYQLVAKHGDFVSQIWLHIHWQSHAPLQGIRECVWDRERCHRLVENRNRLKGFDCTCTSVRLYEGDVVWPCVWFVTLFAANEDFVAPRVLDRMSMMTN